MQSPPRTAAQLGIAVDQITAEQDGLVVSVKSSSPLARSNPMLRAASIMPILAAMGSSGRIRTRIIAEKPCLNCRTPHRTGKPFCSATCSREYSDK